jgi:hypothetical protein
MEIDPFLLRIPASPSLNQPSSSKTSLVISGFLKYPLKTAFPLRYNSPLGYSASVKSPKLGTSRSYILQHGRTPPTCPPSLSQICVEEMHPADSVCP